MITYEVETEDDLMSLLCKQELILQWDKDSKWVYPAKREKGNKDIIYIKVKQWATEKL